jgi:GDP-4-dehydro-6-deoxy-D-mannose reductase
VDTGDLPIRESQPFRPASAYAVSKVAQEMLAYSYHARYGARVIRTRTFNMTGPGEPASLVCSALARQIAEAEAGKTEAVLCVGNLTPQRDFVDVRDAVRAYRLALERGQPGEVYNVCSGQAISIQACLDELGGLAEKGIRVEQDPTRMRPSDLPMSLGDCALLQQQTGWRPAIPLRQSLAELLEEWRRRM